MWKVERSKSQQDQPAQDERNHHGGKRGAALPSPVDVPQVDPECELVQGQTGSHAKNGRQDLVSWTARIEHEADEAGAEQQEDAPHKVVQVRTAVGDDTAGPPR